MKRDFVLEEILSVEYFNDLRTQMGEPPKSTKRSDEERYFRILDGLEFESLSNLLEATTDEYQQRQCIWYPGHMRAGKSQENTLERWEEHEKVLHNVESQYDVLVVRLINNLRLDYHNSDIFRFKKQDSLWELTTFDITARHFDLYDFRGIQTLSGDETSAIYGVCVPNQELHAA